MRRNPRWLIGAVAIVAALGWWALPALAAGGENAQAEADSSARRFAPREPRYRLQLSDELEVGFRFTPEFDQKVTVQPDGFISLLDVGDFKAAGLTLEEVRQEIIRRYAGILHDPVVTVKLTKFNKPYIIVGGEVARPGRLDFQDDLTLSDAIAMAGDFTIRARSTEVMLIRRVSRDMVEVKKVNVKTARNGRPEEDVRLRPGIRSLSPARRWARSTAS